MRDLTLHVSEKHFYPVKKSDILSINTEKPIDFRGFMQIGKFLSILCMLTLASGCARIKILKEKLYVHAPCNDNLSKPNQPAHVITIFVHGTKLFTRMILKDFFHSPDGLVLASTFDKKYYLRTIADTLSVADPVNYSSQNMYLFGWNGDLSFKERLKAAQQLYKQLVVLVKKYEQEHGIKPKIRIITHSHGGNVH